MGITGCADLASWKCWFLLLSYSFLSLWGESKLAKMVWSGFLAPRPLSLAPCFISDYVTAVSEGKWHILLNMCLGSSGLNLTWFRYTYQLALTRVSTGYTSSHWFSCSIEKTSCWILHLPQIVYSGQTSMDLPPCSHRCPVFTSVCCLNGFL